ncbi:MAG: glycosyl transferase family 1 [Parcubacteria group bacterium CG11_big_fil_rev_8_21_14_0_20_39_14]|nr:MAG: glycosyl transferase family 1 [Parcubacteria group bacterium CG11_big_fil_rev_8_21_14_0_20_39_14]PIS35185.1 MAG: glycosyl transferase family 1 [Parcubacteria group bacterium CG08_land_8_20_14_0_20_38_56]
MLPYVRVPTIKLENYQGVISDELFDEVKILAKELKGLKVTFVNSTPRGGGVTEILKSLVGLMLGIGLKTEWHIIPPGRKFFGLTKELHNALQGKEFSLSFKARRLYQHHMERSAELMLDMESNVWIINDPQPAGVIHYLPNFHPSVAHFHIDTSHPNKDTWNFIEPILLAYDKIIFSAKEFVASTLPKRKIKIFAPAIDPLSDKNKPLSLQTAKTILESFGIDPTKPLVTQVSRFDPWKDPMGVIQAYYLAKNKIPNLQLALVGLFLAFDDSEAMRIFKQVKKHAGGDPDIFMFSDPQELGSLKVDIFVNAFQVGSDVILQKSIREGFGLTVAEAMWKEKPVIGGNVGGIKIQIKNGENGFLVSSPQETAKRIVQIIKNPALAEKMGKNAHQTVKEKFLMPRLLRDYLKLFKELV